LVIDGQVDTAGHVLFTVEIQAMFLQA